MLKLKFLNFTKKPKEYRLVKDTRLIDNEIMRYRIQVKRLRGWRNEIFKTEHPVCWVKSKDEGMQIVKFLKGKMIWQ
jgi:hypothetical protein